MVKRTPSDKKISIGNDSIRYTITAIMKDVPENSHFEFDMLGSFLTHWRANSENWLSNSFSTYLLLREGASHKDVEQKIKPVLEKYVGPQIEAALGLTIADWVNSGNRYNLYLQPLDDIHLNPSIRHSAKPSNSKKYIYVFSIVVVLIIFVAIINYMNLSTAKSFNRSKEVGLRKVSGSSRGLIVGQFLFESIMLTLVSLVFALAIVQLALPSINKVTMLHLQLNFFSSWYIVPLLIFLAIAVGILAGSYPSFYLSSFNPVSIIAGFKKGSKKSVLRSVLVVFQFSVSVIIIICTLIVFKQIKFMNTKDLGFEEEQLMIIKSAETLGNYSKIKVFQEQISKYPGVVSSSNSTSVPYHPNENRTYLLDGSEQAVFMSLNYIDPNFLETYQMRIIQGRTFTDEDVDTFSVVINESAVEKFGLKDPLSVKFIQPDTSLQKIRFQVIGIVKNFHFQSLHEDIHPYAFIIKPNGGNGVVTYRLGYHLKTRTKP
ncbi:MAG: FtsX-like permease family protein [Bacteroidales bacterium]|nr:FtsX-like permease family protein [Bacteroidales bacterium]